MFPEYEQQTLYGALVVTATAPYKSSFYYYCHYYYCRLNQK